MDTNTIGMLVSTGVSTLALILSVILKKKGIDTTTLQEIQHKAELKKQKYIEKQCAKHNIEINKEQ